MELTGTVTRIDAPVSREHQGKTYTSQKIRIKTNEQYPNVYELEVREAKMGILSNIQIGNDITAHINLKGREWEKDGKSSVFLSLDMWKCDVVGTGIHTQTSTVHEGVNSPNGYDIPTADKVDDLPF